MILAVLIPLLAQTSSMRLPPAGPVPPPDAGEQAIMQPVNALLAGIGARDPAALSAEILAGGSATSVSERADGTRTVQRRPWSEVLARFRPGPEKFEERLRDPAIESDGDVAMVWGNYVFLIDGKVHHCGIDHFDLVRENGTWKIANVTWSERLAGCSAQ